MKTKQSPCLTSFPVSAGSPLPPKSPTLWPTPNTSDALGSKEGKLVGNRLVNPNGKDYGVGLREAAALNPSPTPKSNPSPAPCITGTFPIASALVESRMLRAVQSLSDAVHSRLSSLEASLASRTVAPGSGLRVQMIETFGASVGESLATYDPASHSLRMSQACLPLNLEGSSIESLATWPRCGMLVSGRLYQLPPLAHPIDGNESGLSAEMNWPTARSESGVSRKPGTGGKCLQEEARRYSGPPSTATGRADPVKPSTDGKRQELWQTPKATNADCSVIHHPQRSDGGQPNLAAQINGKLNPHWVMTLMGYPPLWVELGRKFTTASRNSKAQATPSCQSVLPSCSTQSGGN